MSHKKQIHVQVGKSFYNGLILHLLPEGVLQIQDRKIGEKNIFLFEITKLDEYEYDGTKNKTNCN